MSVGPLTAKTGWSLPRRLFARFLSGVAGLLLRGVFRSVEVVGQTVREGPVLVIANHFWGFFDAVLVYYLLGGRVYFLAKSGLFKFKAAALLFKALGALPVYRTGEGSPRDNIATFAACYEALKEGRTIALFPEGTSTHQSKLLPVKTGAARIALGARSRGTTGLQIVPIGITYDDRWKVRGRVVVEIGPALDLDIEVDRFAPAGSDQSETNREAVSKLTAELEQRLLRVVPGYESGEQAIMLGFAAEVALRQPEKPRQQPPLTKRETLSRRLATADQFQLEELTAAVEDYRRSLDALGLDDQQVFLYPTWRLGRRLLLTIVGAGVLLPAAIVGLLLNLPPLLLLFASERIALGPYLRSIVRPLLALFAFPITWGVWAALVPPDQPLWVSVVIFLASPLLGLLALFVFGRIEVLAHRWEGWAKLLGAHGLRSRLFVRRNRVVEAVKAMSVQPEWLTSDDVGA